MGNSLSWAAGNSLLSWGLDAALGAKSDRFCPGAQPGAPSGAINVPASGPDVRRRGGLGANQRRPGGGRQSEGERAGSEPQTASDVAYTSGRRSRHRVIAS